MLLNSFNIEKFDITKLFILGFLEGWSPKIDKNPIISGKNLKVRDISKKKEQMAILIFVLSK